MSIQVLFACCVTRDGSARLNFTHLAGQIGKKHQGSSPTLGPLLCRPQRFMPFPVISANCPMNKVMKDQTKTLKKGEKLFKGN